MTSPVARERQGADDNGPSSPNSPRSNGMKSKSSGWFPSANAVARTMVIVLVVILLAQWLGVIAKTTASAGGPSAAGQSPPIRNGHPPANQNDAAVEDATTAAVRPTSVDGLDQSLVEVVPLKDVTPVPESALGQKCTCPSKCVIAMCGGSEGNAAIRFVRCSKCRSEISSGNCVAAQPLSLDCTNNKDMKIVDAVRHCLANDPHLIAPTVFTVAADAAAGSSRLLVCDNGELSNCQSRIGALEAKVLAQAARYTQGLVTTSGTQPVQLIDFGVTDPIVSARFVDTVENSNATVLALHAGSYGASKLQRCAAHSTSSTFTVSHDYSLGAPRSLAPPGSGDALTFLRVYAPGYESNIVQALKRTMSVARPQMITTHTPRGDATMLVAKWLLDQDYIAYQPATCVEVKDTDGVASLREWHRPTPKSRPEGFLAWVPRSTPEVFRPQCASACVQTVCIDGWRTQYNRCSSTERCGPMYGTCDWNITQAACRGDTNWQTILSCTDSRILAPSWFSMVSSHNFLFACRGARDCPRELDISNVKRKLLETMADLSQLSDGPPTHLIDVGSASGIVPLVVAQESPDSMVMVLEPKPANRHLAKISACLGRLKNFKVIDEDVTAPKVRPLDSLLKDLQANPKLVGKRTPTVFHIASADPTPIVASATQWLASSKWKPGSIFLSVPRKGKHFSKPETVWKALVDANNYTASLFQIEGTGRSASITYLSLPTYESFSGLFSFEEEAKYKPPAEVDDRSFVDNSVVVQFSTQLN